MSLNVCLQLLTATFLPFYLILLLVTCVVEYRKVALTCTTIYMLYKSSLLLL